MNLPIKNWLHRLPNPKRRFDRRVRAAAIKQVRKDLILHGKSEHDLSSEDLEYLVAEAESDVKNRIKTAGAAGLLIFLGLS